MEGALEAALQFFSQSTDEKEKLASEDIRRPVRYGASSSGRDFLKHYAHPLSEWIHLWPEAPQSYREKMGRYAVEAQRVALQLIDAIMESLGLGEAYLKDKLERGMQVMTVNSYPHSCKKDPTIGLASHSDFGMVTILLQSCQGLQIVDRSNGHEYWRSAPYVAEALHVHIGDYLEVLSNGQYKSLIHRAVSNTEQRRFSISSIHGFSIDDKVSVPKELVDEQNPKRYRESSFRDFLDYLSNNGCSSNFSFIDELKLLEI